VSVVRSLWYKKEKNSASRKIQKWVRREMLVEKKSRKACNIKMGRRALGRFYKQKINKLG
jgi:hypothetical protein